MLRIIKNRLRASAAPAVFLLITGYFVWNAVHGRSGLEAQRAQAAALVVAQQNLAAAESQRAAWETRIADLSGQSIVPDMLDDEARQVLNLAEPGDLVIQLGGQKSKE